MMIELDGAVMNILPDRTEFIVWTPRECTYCHTMHCCFVNVDGETKCTGCEGKK